MCERETDKGGEGIRFVKAGVEEWAIKNVFSNPESIPYYTDYMCIVIKFENFEHLYIKSADGSHEATEADPAQGRGAGDAHPLRPQSSFVPLF